MSKLKIGLIGANGSVGTELCLLFRDDNDVELVPVVRNVLGAAFLRHNGFDCRIGDVCKQGDADALIGDLDVVVILSYTYSPGVRGFSVNKAIVESCVKNSKPGSQLIYMSSIRAFAGSVDTHTSRIHIPITYDFNKKRLEKVLDKACKAQNKNGISLRLGHVFGEHQSRASALRERIASEPSLNIQVDGNSASNLVHTVTIKECIKACAVTKPKSGVYSLVNVPQWTWKNVFDYYNDTGTELVFKGEQQSQRGIAQRFLDSALGYASSIRTHISDIRQFLPEAIDDVVKHNSDVQSVKGEIQTWLTSHPTTISMPEFAYRPAPGPFIPKLSNSSSLLEST